MDASFNASKRYSDKCKWICIYPLYLNARKTIAHGRRISKQKAVDSPTSQEIYDVLTNTGFKVQLENQVLEWRYQNYICFADLVADASYSCITKSCSVVMYWGHISLYRFNCREIEDNEKKDKMHPLEPNRDPNAKGRVRVQLHNDDGTPFNPKFPTKMSIMLHICEMIPKLKNRQTGGGSGLQTTIPGAKTSKKNKKR